MQSPGLDVALQDLVQARLIEGNSSLCQQGDLGRIDVEADDLEPEFSHAGSVGRTEVSGADDRKARHAARLVVCRPWPETRTSNNSI